MLKSAVQSILSFCEKKKKNRIQKPRVMKPEKSSNSHLPPRPCQNGYYQKDKRVTNTGKDVEKGKLIYCWWVVNQ